jgi:lambda family phage portal protein
LRRVQAREAMRGYSAIEKGRNRDPWYSRGTSADAEISRAGGALRDVMRDLVRNNSYAANAIHNLVTHAVGSGIVPRAKDERVNKLFKKWAKQCDIEGHLDFYGIQALAVRGMLESGDGLVRKRRRTLKDGLAVPLQLQVLEVDHIDRTKTGSFNGLDVFEGIGRNSDGQVVEYWIYKRHPGAPNGTTLESFAVPVEDIAHCFEKKRTQTRGEPWGTPAIKDLRDLAEYESAEILRKKIEACVVGVVTGGDVGEGVSGLPLSEGDPAGV